MSTCLITGGSGGIARALFGRLRGEGWRIARAGRSLGRLAPDDGDLLIEADVATEAGGVRAVAEASAHFGGPPAAVVNAAGTIILPSIPNHRSPVPRLPRRQPRHRLFHRPGLRLLLFSSVAASVGVPSHAAIAMAKGAVEALVRSLAADHSAMGPRVNAIAPGLMATRLTTRLVANEAARKAVAAQYPLGRHGEVEDGAALAAFLLGPGGDWITGQVIALDRGFTAVRPTVRAGA